MPGHVMVERLDKSDQHHIVTISNLIRFKVTPRLSFQVAQNSSTNCSLFTDHRFSVMAGNVVEFYPVPVHIIEYGHTGLSPIRLRPCPPRE